MPAFDQCHDQVVRALQKDGWRLENAPVYLSFRRRNIHIDLELSRGTNGTRRQIMLVEVKCFPDEDSKTRDLYVAIGQYLVYQAMLAALGIEQPLYLSVPEDIFTRFFDAIVMRVIQNNRIKLVVVNLETETISQWIE